MAKKRCRRVYSKRGIIMILSLFFLLLIGALIAWEQADRGAGSKVGKPAADWSTDLDFILRSDDVASFTSEAGGEKKPSAGTKADRDDLKTGSDDDSIKAGSDKRGPGEEQNEVKLTLFFSDRECASFIAEERCSAKGDKSLPEMAIDELIKGPERMDLIRTIPEGTRLNSMHIEDGTAYVDFSKELVENHWGGSTGEIMTIGSIANTLTSFDGIERVQILVEGEAIETLAGHYYLLEPVEAIAY